MSPTFDRQRALETIRCRSAPWDIVIVGGGATGVAVAMDAASRGLDVVLMERFDFGSGTSSRSTKLVHGGVRYLKQGNVTLVRDALRERTRLKENAPHLVHDKTFLIPCRNLWQCCFYGIGLKLYDLLATGDRFGRSSFLSADNAIARSPALRREPMRGAVLYHDGQFDDARLLINMAQTAAAHGAILVNYLAVSGIAKDSTGNVQGVIAFDSESGETFEISARSVINAAGPFCDDVRRLDQSECLPLVAASQGIHLVLPKELFPGDTALIVPKTSDGRVIFIVPWLDHAILGTTDTPIEHAIPEPSPQPQEIQFLLDTAAEYLSRPPTISDVLSVFTGIRPLVKGDPSARTASLSRDHLIQVSPSKLITITGGKWTTVRKMAEDVVDQAVTIGKLGASPCITETLPIQDSLGTESFNACGIRDDPFAKIHPQLNLCRWHVARAVRDEMARTVEDVLARRTRALFLNAKATLEAAPAVANVMADLMGKDQDWVQSQLLAFESVARHYQPEMPALPER